MTEIDLYKTLGKAVAQRRKELKLTQADVAAMIGMSRAALANIETGRQKVMLHQVYQLARALDLADIRSLAPDMPDSRTPGSSTPVEGSKLTGVQREQVDRAVQELRKTRRPLGHRSS